MLGHRRGIGCIMVHVVTVADLRRATVAAAVVSDDAEALGDEEQHLRVPVVRAKGPAVMKDDGLALAPVLVEYLNAILGGDCAHDHCSSSAIASAISCGRTCGIAFG